MQSDKLSFDKVKHEYEHDGNKMLSVTKVLPDIPEYLLYKQTFIDKTLLGSRVHACCDAINQHYMAHEEVPCKDAYWNETNQEKDLPYIQAYIKFLQERKPIILFSELQDYHRRYRYAGTIDGVMRIEKDKYITDIKTSASVAPYAKLQLAAYLRMWNDNHPNRKIFKRMIIHLLPDGEYKLIRYPISDISRDFDIFLCKLKSAQWDAENMGERF